MAKRKLKGKLKLKKKRRKKENSGHHYFEKETNPPSMGPILANYWVAQRNVFGFEFRVCSWEQFSSDEYSQLGVLRLEID